MCSSNFESERIGSKLLQNALEMRWILVLTFFLILPPLLAQQKKEFLFQSDRKKIRLRFQFINNLIVIPVTVNGQELTFLLDSGVGKTLLFNNENVSQLHFENKNRYNLSGLGQGEALQAYLTQGNTIQLGQLLGVNQDILLVDKIDFSFSRRMGRQIEGVLGSEFFKTYPIKIDYINRKISIYNNQYPYTFPQKATQYPLQFHHNKPHVQMKFNQNGEGSMLSTFLIDTGSSDALWLFDAHESIEKTTPVFNDFLGQGINGNIFGDRGKINSIQLSKRPIKDVKVAYPEMDNFKTIDLLSGRVGSIGGELLSRFTVYFDYPNQRMALQPNRKIEAPFYFNMSGIELQYNGVELRTSKVNNSGGIKYDKEGNNRGIEIFLRDVIQYEFQDVIEIAEVRPNSPAAQSGIRKGDILYRINNHKLNHLKLHEVAGMLQRKPGKKIKLLLRRNKEMLTKTFVLTPLFDSPPDF